MKNWENYTQSSDFTDIYNYINQEYEVFNVYFHQLSLNVKKNYQNSPYSSLPILIPDHINSDLSQPIDPILKKVLTEYCRFLIKSIVVNKQKPLAQQKKMWVHVNRVLDCLILDQVFYGFRRFLYLRMRGSCNSISNSIMKRIISWNLRLQLRGLKASWDFLKSDFFAPFVIY